MLQHVCRNIVNALSDRTTIKHKNKLYSFTVFTLITPNACSRARVAYICRRTIRPDSLEHTHTHTYNSAFVLANSVRALCNPGPSTQKHTHKDDYSATQVFIFLETGRRQHGRMACALVSITFRQAALLAQSGCSLLTHSLSHSTRTSVKCLAVGSGTTLTRRCLGCCVWIYALCVWLG